MFSCEFCEISKNTSNGCFWKCVFSDKLVQNIVGKFTKLSKIVLSIKCFTAPFLFCNSVAELSNSIFCVAVCGSFRRALLNLIWQNYIAPNLLKDQAILDMKQCYLNINYMRQFFLAQTRRSNIWSEQANTKQRIWKIVVANKKVKVSCETISSVKYNCSNTLNCRKIWYRWCRYFPNFWLNFT